MKDFTAQAMEIKQFLLGLLETERAEQIESRIFAESDFAEEVQIVESELITDYRKGNLTPEERSIFERKYLASPANRRAVEYENTFSEFLHRERATKASLPETSTPPAPQKEPEQKSWLARLQSLFTTSPALAYSISVTVVLLLAVGLFWYVSREDAAQIERQARELELARLNIEADPASRGQEVAVVDLKPTQRNGGAMSRVAMSDNKQDGLVKFRLNLMPHDAARYRAVFLDDRRQELFAISNLTAQNTPDGSQLWLFVPARYLRRGDYQIDVSRLMGDGTYQNDGTYFFRVTANR
jgi:anti-sigma-K factor RskA